MDMKGATYLVLLIFLLGETQGTTRYFVKMKTNTSELFKAKADNLGVPEPLIAITRNPLNDRAETAFEESDDDRLIKELASEERDKRNSYEASTFNPEVLNKFLEEYANKIKSTTEKNPRYPFRIIKPTTESLLLEIENEKTPTPPVEEQESTKYGELNSTSTVNQEEGVVDTLNDTFKRNKYYGTNTHDDRNGWVTLEAIPWSKSKISKWQANPSTQRPWPELKPWDKPSIAKPWTADYSVRPIYDSNKQWYDKPKPHWPENDKPWPKPTTRPSYYPDKHEDVANQAQKWPPERPSWNKYQDAHRPNTDIITDDRPSNFPNTWSKPPSTKPTYQFIDRYFEKNPGEESNDWHDFPSRYDQMNDRLRVTTERPNFSQYQYVNNHPPTYPANGDGQWVLLSTNRGYSKSRQRSMKIDTPEPNVNGTKAVGGKREEHDPAIAVMTSKRQVRLTVLPSINGTNTTTSHGGLLEVEKTFKSVDQSRKEYELEHQILNQTVLKKRPIRNSLAVGAPSNSAVLAAIGAGMLPATMAMMIPMILGRRKRDLASTTMHLFPTESHHRITNFHDLRNNRGRTKNRQA